MYKFRFQIRKALNFFKKPALLNKTAILSLFLFFSIPIVLPAQTANLRFRHILPDQGLSQASVHVICQDYHGFMWFGTEDGLDRYDGVSFRSYKNDYADSNTISYNHISALYEDHNKELWIGTVGGGLNKYDRAHDSFIRFTHIDGNLNSISDNFVRAIVEDKSGNLWIGTDNGLNKFNPQSGKFTPIYANREHHYNLSHNKITALLADSKERLWVGTNGGGLNRLDPGAKRFRHYSTNSTSPVSLSDNSVLYIFEDIHGTIWVGTENGLNKFTEDKNSFVRFSAAQGSGLSHNRISAILGDKNGLLWIATEGGGLNRFNPATNTFTTYKSNLYNAQSLSDNNIYSLYRDFSGILWIGTSKGLSLYDKAGNKFQHIKSIPDNPNSLNDNFVFALFQDKKGIIWIGTHGGGLNRWDRKTNKYEHFLNNPENAASISSNKIRAIYEDRFGVLWVGTENGLNQFDYRTRRFRRFMNRPKNKNSISSNFIRAFCEDKNGRLWIGTTNGLNLFNRENSTFTHFFHSNKNPNSISNNYIYRILEDRNGYLWIGTLDGLNKFDPQTKKFISYHESRSDTSQLNNDEILSLFEDKDGVLWIGTALGINRFDKSANKFFHLTDADGLPSNLIFDILGDNSGNLWISTTKGLCKYSPVQKTFRNFDVSDGLQGNEFNLGAAFFCKDGTMMFGGINGFNVFNPDSVRRSNYIPPVVLTDLQLFNKSVSVSHDSKKDAVLKKSITETKEITLSYTDRVFSLQFAALHYSSPERNQYAYILDGLENEWNYVGNRNFALYTNVPPGEYTFEVKGSNADHIWNEKAATLRIIITPPFWATSWFKALALLLVLTLIVVFYKVRTKAIRERNLYLTRQIEERTAEIRHKNEALKEEMLKRDKVQKALDASEKRLRSIFENSTVGLYRTTPEGKIQLANSALINMMGYSTFEEIAGLNLEENKEEYFEFRSEFRKKLEAEGKVIGWEDTYHRRDKTKIYIRESAILIKDEYDKPLYYEGTVEDITEQKIAQQHLLKAKEAAESATRAKSEFLANMSHEIRTPMNGVIGMTGLLLDTDMTKEQRDFAETIKTSADNLLSVINDILDFSKIEAGKMDMEMIEFDLRNTVEDVTNILAFKAFNKGLELACVISNDLPSQLLGDPGRVRQILTNLMNNAIKFTSEGEVTVRVKAEKKSDTHVFVRFEISDTGIGIPKDRQNLLFKSFSQVDASTTRKFGGTGLGLAISKNLVEMMGGQIGVDSDEKKGSTFWFTALFERQKNIKKIKMADQKDIVNQYILIVDDNKTNRFVLKEQLKFFGCQFAEACNGAEALKKLHEARANGAPFNIAILDMQMPEMSGEELGKLIKSDPKLKKTTLLMLTSVGERGDAAKLQRIGFAAYLTKPIKQAQLYDCLAAVIGKGDADSSDKPDRIVTKHSISEYSRKKIKILLAEDNMINQKVALRILSKMGYIADAVENGAQAVDAVKSEQYDLVLMDVQMPEMDGFEATGKIRENERNTGKHIPIIAMTAHAMKGDRERCLIAGMDDYVSKPIQQNELNAAILRQSSSSEKEKVHL